MERFGDRAREWDTDHPELDAVGREKLGLGLGQAIQPIRVRAEVGEVIIFVAHLIHRGVGRSSDETSDNVRLHTYFYPAVVPFPAKTETVPVPRWIRKLCGAPVPDLQPSATHRRSRTRKQGARSASGKDTLTPRGGRPENEAESRVQLQPGVGQSGPQAEQPAPLVVPGTQREPPLPNPGFTEEGAKEPPVPVEISSDTGDDAPPSAGPRGSSQRPASHQLAVGNAEWKSLTRRQRKRRRHGWNRAHAPPEEREVSARTVIGPSAGPQAQGRQQND